MTQSIQQRNKALVLQAFDLLFNKRDYAAAEKVGRRITFSTVRTLSPDGKGCSA